MRENRQSGSEVGAAQTYALSLPLSLKDFCKRLKGKGEVLVKEGRVVVTYPRRAHNPICVLSLGTGYLKKSLG